jgi:ABC-2 type transport system permease protein
MFLLLVIAGSLAVFFQLANIRTTDGFEILPTTWKMLTLPMLMFTGVINVVTFLYAGMLVQRARVAKMNGLIDVSPVDNWTLMLAQFLALVKMQAILLSIIMIAGIAAQAFNGFYRFEIGHYLFELYGLRWVDFMIWAMVAIFIQTIFTNAYLGLFLLIGGSIGMAVLPQFGVEPAIFRYNMGPVFDYSDMDGYGNSLLPYLTYKMYWLIFGIFLLLGTLLFWMRGHTFSFGERLQVLFQRVKSPMGIGMLLVIIGFVSFGFLIHQQEKAAMGGITSNSDERRAMQQFKQQFGHLKYTLQPKITDVEVHLDIFPTQQRFEANGTYTIINKNHVPIDTLIVRTGFDEITEYQLSEKATPIISDKGFHFDIWKLEKALQPNDSLTLNFKIQPPSNTLFRKYHNVKSNGTFLSIDIFPRLGMLDFSKRPMPNDTSVLNTSYMAKDADWVSFEATVSTSKNQTALAPGYLQKTWTVDNRKYFHYKMDTPIKFFFGFNSGRFEILRDSLNGVSLEVYYDKKHDYNINRMMQGLKGALAFCNENYSTYQHRQARIIEYPTTLGSYSTTFANSIPFAEYNFLADIREYEGDIDIPFYVAAHELAHQWWGNQVVPADVLGAKMITESLAEYTALKVLEQTYDEAKMHQFLKVDLDSYLRGRKREYNTESPLAYAKGGQKYIHYRKGAMVFYALSDYLGEERFHEVLKTFIAQTKYQKPYTTSIELVNLIENALPDSLKYLIEDMFYTVTLYDNAVDNAQFKKLDNGKYEVKIDVQARKFRIEGKGKRNYKNEEGESIKYQSDDLTSPILSLPLADYIEIGIKNEKGEYLYLNKHQFQQIKNTITIVVDELPKSVGIDPLHKLVDVKSWDNLKDL